MQGLWKNNVSSWNHKDIKRKKQTFDNFIKDKGRLALKHHSGRRRYPKCDEEIYRVENPMVKITEPLPEKKYIKETSAYRVTVHYISSYKDEEYTITHNYCGEIFEKTYIRKVPVKSWKEIVCFFDENEDSYLRYPIELKSKKPLSKILPRFTAYGAMYDVAYKQKLTTVVPLNWEKHKNWDNTWHVSDELFYNQKEFLYGKILPDWKRRTFYNDGKRRKEGQKFVNKLERTHLRNWIVKEDWDREIKTHQYSKSISWLIH